MNYDFMFLPIVYTKDELWNEEIIVKNVLKKEKIHEMISHLIEKSNGFYDSSTHINLNEINRYEEQFVGVFGTKNDIKTCIKKIFDLNEEMMKKYENLQEGLYFIKQNRVNQQYLFYWPNEHFGYYQLDNNAALFLRILKELVGDIIIRISREEYEILHKLSAVKKKFRNNIEEFKIENVKDTDYSLKLEKSFEIKMNIDKYGKKVIHLSGPVPFMYYSIIGDKEEVENKKEITHNDIKEFLKIKSNKYYICLDKNISRKNVRAISKALLIPDCEKLIKDIEMKEIERYNLMDESDHFYNKHISKIENWVALLITCQEEAYLFKIIRSNLSENIFEEEEDENYVNTLNIKHLYLNSLKKILNDFKHDIIDIYMKHQTRGTKIYNYISWKNELYKMKSVLNNKKLKKNTHEIIKENKNKFQNKIKTHIDSLNLKENIKIKIKMLSEEIYNMNEKLHQRLKGVIHDINIKIVNEKKIIIENIRIEDMKEKCLLSYKKTKTLVKNEKIIISKFTQKEITSGPKKNSLNVEKIYFQAIINNNGKLVKIFLLKFCIICIYNKSNECEIVIKKNASTKPFKFSEINPKICAFNKITNRLIVYDESKKIISFLKVDETFIDIRKEDHSYKVNERIIDLHVIDQKNYLCLIDIKRKVYIYDIIAKITLSNTFVVENYKKSLIAKNGIFLMLFNKKDEKVQISVHLLWSDCASNGVVKIGDMIRKIDIEDIDLNSLELLKIKEKEYLVYYDDKNLQIISYSINFEDATFQIISHKINETEDKNYTKLNYFSHSLYKFPINNPINKSYLRFKTFFCHANKNDLEFYNKNKLKISKFFIKEIENNTKKNINKINWTERNITEDDLLNLDFSVIKLGDFIQKLIQLFPCQIAISTQNEFGLLYEGEQINAYENCRTIKDYSSTLSFGLHESLFMNHHGEIKVVSCMGYQSSGKSLTLNYLSGSLFDIRGNACTAGVWMSVRVHENILYVILDFEGLGSKNTSDGDILLSIFGAAISNMTIYKSEKSLTMELKSVFDSFQRGIKKIKDDPKLFNGKFLANINNVQRNDKDSVVNEIKGQLREIMGFKDKEENFMHKMYGGKYSILASPPILDKEFYKDFKKMLNFLKDEKSFFKSGKSFMYHLKLLMAKMKIKDYLPISAQKLKFINDKIFEKLESVIKYGKYKNSFGVNNLETISNNTKIHNPTLERIQKEIKTFPKNLLLSKQDFLDFVSKMKDEDYIFDNIIDSKKMLISQFNKLLERTSSNHKRYIKNFTFFIYLVAIKRRLLVFDWANSSLNELNITDAHKKVDLKPIKREFDAIISKMRICGKECSKCNFSCLLFVDHTENHDCLMEIVFSTRKENLNHKCEEKCTYCNQEDNLFCEKKAGHEGNHYCEKYNHTCKEICSTLPDCKELCENKIGHIGKHECGQKHKCPYQCSVYGCVDSCAKSFEKKHKEHICPSLICYQKCQIYPNCKLGCKESHKHTGKHDCKKSHKCNNKCKINGWCFVESKTKKENRVYQSMVSGEISYEYTEKYPKKNDCAVDIPLGKQDHKGDCRCCENINYINKHICKTSCDLCGYLCEKEFDHEGFCSTSHGNMKNGMIVSKKENITFENYSLLRGESSEFIKSCDSLCIYKGRGHIHLLPCKYTKDTCPPDQEKSHTSIKNNNTMEEYDLCSHEVYFRMKRWEDPVKSIDDIENFKKCNYMCTYQNHNQNDDKFCIHPVLHNPIKQITTGNIISKNGHEFYCTHDSHKKAHIIFCIDRSSSMSSNDIQPEFKFKNTLLLCNRLGCALEKILEFIEVRKCKGKKDDIISVITFESKAEILLNRVDMTFDFEGKFNILDAYGGTNFYDPICKASEIMDVSEQSIIIFLSDGEAQSSENKINQIKKTHKDMRVHCIYISGGVFSYGGEGILKSMSKCTSGGTFRRCETGIELKEQFAFLAAKGVEIYDVVKKN